MQYFRKWSTAAVIATAILFLRPGFGAPALTTIQDILYKADGTRFNGTVTIAWTSFQSVDGTPVATQSVTVQVVNGVFRVQLVPTTTATAGANYAVTYNSQGKYQFLETWAVPLSASTLRIRDVRVGTGTVVGGSTSPGASTTILIADVTSLSSELSLRASKGAGFQPGKAAVINTSGLLDGASGNDADCVHVDGSSGACGGGGGGVAVTFVDNETPVGVVDGSNAGFRLAVAPMPASSVSIYRNGMLMRQNLDYTMSGSAIVFVPAAVPQPGDVLMASYRAGDASNPLSSLAYPQVVCSAAGASTTLTTATTLGTCTLPAGLIGAGDRLEIRADLTHEGQTSGFQAAIVWGATPILSMSCQPLEAQLPVLSSVSVTASRSYWTSEIKRATPLVTSGSATDSISGNITIAFTGTMLAQGVDTVTLRNFTVVRYPAQKNP